MTFVRILLSRLRGLFRRGDGEAGLRDEIQTHLQFLIAQHVQAGMSMREARVAARRDFGGVDQIREQYRDQTGFPWLDAWRIDSRYAFRTLTKDWRFTAIAITTLALGIGINTAVFTVTNGALFRGTPHIDSTNRIVYLQTARGLSYPDFQDWRAQAQSFDGQIGVVFIAGNRTRLEDQRGLSDVYDATQLSANAFRVLGQQPILGRDFLPSDETPGAPPVIMLSYHLWERRYGKDPAVIGRTVRINSTPSSWGAVDLATSTPATVIGIMPSEFRFPFYRVDLWLPLVPTAGMVTPDLQDRQRRSFMLAFGRLADGVTIEQARTEMAAIGRRLESLYPDTNRGVVPSVKSFHEFWLGPNAVPLYASMWGAVAFVLLIACANVANLLLARGIGRSRELAIRAALGATRWRIVRQLLLESAMLASAAGVSGGLVASWGIRAYNGVANSPYSYAQWDFVVDERVLMYLAVVSFITALLFGLVPALRFSREDVQSMLKRGGGGAIGGSYGARLSDVLIAAEVALALVLLVGAGVMIRSVMMIARADLGVKTANVLTTLVGLPSGRYPDTQARSVIVRQLITRTGALPGVESVAIATALPGGPVFGAAAGAYEIRSSAPLRDVQSRPTAAVVSISADYFQTLGTSMRQGRAFTETDGTTDTPVAIVNERLASLAWPHHDALGQQFRLLTRREFMGDAKPDDWLTVVGVAPNIVQNDRTGQRFDPVVYVPFQQKPATALWLVTKTRVPSAGIIATVRGEIEAIDRNLLVNAGDYTPAASLNELLESNYRSNSVNGSLFLIFAGTALFLASVGLYAVVVHRVGHRTQEIGVRTALGASARDIRVLILRDGIRPVAAGLAIGLVGALAMTQVLKSQLVNVSPADPVSVTVACIALIVSALVGCMIPARRAARVDPLTALRCE